MTDRCNLRCRYCRPAEGMPWLPPREQTLSFEAIERLVRLLVALGIADVRLIGGEPLVRELPALAVRLALPTKQWPGLREIERSFDGASTASPRPEPGGRSPGGPASRSGEHADRPAPASGG